MSEPTPATSTGASTSVRSGPGTARGAPDGKARRAPTTDKRLERAFELLAHDSVSVLSLDVFDTLLWRKVPEPEQAFVLLGLRLSAEDRLPRRMDSNALADLRVHAERRAREQREASGRGVEVTLREIYALLPPHLLRRAGADELMGQEIELERSLLVPDLDVLELVRAARDRGKRVIGVSDTYFSEPQVRSFLSAAPLGSLPLDELFVSSAHRVGKGSGLWRIVLERLGVRPRELLHVGDNHAADVEAPSRLGIQTVYFERRPETLARVIERENLHAHAPLSRYHGDYGLTALRSKLLHRAELHDQPPELRPFWAFGATNLGPPLAGFAEWVHEQAEEIGTSKVFCLMREGELLARMINSAGAHLASPLEAEPIWLSRQVCARASIFEGTREELARLFARRRMPTVAQFCATLGLDVAEVRGFTGHGDAWLGEARLVDELLERLTFDAQLRAKICAGAAELRSRVVRYVEGMRPAGEERIVLVDLGWAATIQTLLDGIMRAADAAHPLATTGLYLLTNERAIEPLLAGSDVRGFLASAGHPASSVKAFARSPEILEQICMPDHGTQVGFTAELEPVLAEPMAAVLQTAERASVQAGIFAFQREWARYRTTAPSALVPLTEYGEDLLRSILVRAMTAPTVEEAVLFGRWLHDENFGSSAVEPIIPQTSTKAARYLEPHSLAAIPMSELYWPFGLAALQDEYLARSIEAGQTGVLPWDAFSSPLETGPFEIYCDRGWGFRREGMALVHARRNRLGLSYANGAVVGDLIRRVRVYPAKAPCVLRLDWLRLRCHRSGSTDPVIVDFETPEQIAQLKRGGCRPIGPKAFLVQGGGGSFTVDLERLLDGRVHTVHVECGFALLPLAPSGLRGVPVRIKQALRQRAKQGRLGGPIRAVYSLLRRLD